MVLSDFNAGGFQYVFDDFSQSYDASAGTVRLTDSINGWGGGGTNFADPIDLTGLLDQYVQADFRVEPNHAVDYFVIELYDTSDRSVKFNAPTMPSQGADFNRWISNTTLGNPSDGIGDYQNFDYSQVRTWQLLGDYGTTVPFDVSFDQVRIAPEAPELYQGSSPNATWRAEAETRIDQIRKADLQINVTHADGRAASGAEINIAQIGHEFGFGTAFAARLLDGPAANTTYQNKLREHFNLAVPENALKWPAWEGDYGQNFSQQRAIGALDWLDANGIDARGHVMVWPSFNNSPNNVADLQNDPAALRQAVLDHIADIGASVGDRVFEWDVVNETRTNNDFMALLGDDVLVDWFNAADQATDARLFLNEFGLITGGDSNAGNRAVHHQTIQGILNGGAPLEGLGIQGHFRPNDLTGIEQVWDIFDEFGAYGLPVAITEFDFETTNRELQASYSADFLTAAFAHESVREFLNWGFWAGAHWRPEAAFYDEDWNLRPHGEAVFDLIFEQWWTEEMLNADDQGTAELRGFKGEYEITVTLNGVSQVVTVTLGDDGQIIDVILPEAILGDYNGDGTVNTADYTVWADSFNTTVNPFDGADGNGDGVIDTADYTIWADNFGTTAALNLDTLSTPEPSSLSLVGLAGLLATRRPSSRRSTTNT